MQRTTFLGRRIINLGRNDSPHDTLTINDFFQNVAIFGSTGSGKSSGSSANLIRALLNKQGLAPHEKVGMVVYLYKSGDADDWLEYAWEQQREDDIIHIRADDTDVFNILSLYQEEEPINAVNAIMNVASLSMDGQRKQSESYWESELRKRLDRLVRLVQISGEDLTLKNLYRLHLTAPAEVEQLQDEAFTSRSFLWEMMGKAAQRVGNEHPDFKLVEDYFIYEMTALNDRTASSILAMTGATLEPFISSKILSNLLGGQSKLDLYEVFTGKILLMDISVQQHKHVGRIAQCALAYALMEAVEKRDLKTHGNPVIFHIDECQNFLTSFTNLFMSVSRSSRTGSILMSQNISNLMSTLGGSKEGEAKVNALLGLCNLKIFHANNCHITNEWAAKTIGRAFQNISSISVGSEASSTASSKKELHYLKEPRAFTTLKNGGLLYQYLVDAIIAGTARTFSNGFNFLETSFKQHFAQ